MKNKIKRLPSKPSALINLALDDLFLVETDVRYIIDMNAWHIGESQAYPCSVCLAGAVMAKTLKADRGKHYWHDAFGPSNAKKFLAIEDFRRGRWDAGMGSLGLRRRMPKSLNKIYVPSYAETRIGFKSVMRAAAALLKAAGL